MKPSIIVAVCHNGDSLSCAAIECQADGSTAVLGDASVELSPDSSVSEAVNRLLVRAEDQTEVMIREVVFHGDGENVEEIERALMDVPVKVIPANHPAANAIEIGIWWAGRSSPS
jgi:delta 1-pyrroline-5-carboxylate dehydrogenase